MPVAKAAKEYGVHYTSIYSWMNKGIKAHTKVRANTGTTKILSTTTVNKSGIISILPTETDKFQPRVKEVILHVSGTFVPAKGQLRITRELLNYLNEVGAHLTK